MMITFLKTLFQKLFLDAPGEDPNIPDPDALGLIPITLVPESESDGNS